MLDWWTLCESHLFRLYYVIFWFSVVNDYTNIFFAQRKEWKKTFLLFLQIKHIWYGMEVNNIFKTWSLVEDWLSPAARTLSRFYCPPAEINSRRWTISISHTKQHKYLWCLKWKWKIKPNWYKIRVWLFQGWLISKLFHCVKVDCCKDPPKLPF